MSTTERRILPPLVAGQRLDRATFHERYEAMPPDTRAELIGGVVSMPSPLGNEHGDADGDIGYWLGHYKRFTPGVRSPRNATTQLGDFGEPQPDCQLRLPEELGGQSHIDAEGYITGPPELVLEIGRSSRRIDLDPKKADYERAGVLEYVFVGLAPQEVRWFVRRGGRFLEKSSDRDGIFRSEVFPGLWLNPQSFFAEDMDGLIATLEQGLATPEHAAFVERLAARAQAPR